LLYPTEGRGAGDSQERHPEGLAAMSMLVKFIEAHEARQAAREALKAK
jgi:hypothetical protein